MDKRETLWMVQYRPYSNCTLVRSIQKTEALAMARATEVKQSNCRDIAIITLKETEREQVT